MEKIKLATLPTAENYNGGQNAERVLRYTLTGEIAKADHRPATECADCLDIQIKSYHATVGRGTDIDAILDADVARRFAYIPRGNEIAYIMTREEWRGLVENFHSIDRESAKNGGGTKIRLSRAENKIIEWCEGRL